MCRNIRTLHNFEPPVTAEEIHDAALQYVRKVSGYTKPPAANRAAFERALAGVTRETTRLLASLVASAPARTREAEAAKARERWQRREARMLADAKASATAPRRQRGARSPRPARAASSARSPR